MVVGMHLSLPARDARVAITSLAFMLLEVPEPVWKTSIGKCASWSPAATCSAALRMDVACACRQQSKPALTSAAAALTSPSARMKPRGIGRPEIGKFSHRTLGLRAPQGIGRDLQFTHAVVLDAECARFGHSSMLPVLGERGARGRA